MTQANGLVALLAIAGTGAPAVADVQFFPPFQHELSGSDPRRCAVANLDGSGDVRPRRRNRPPRKRAHP